MKNHGCLIYSFRNFEVYANATGSGCGGEGPVYQTKGREGSGGGGVVI
jgi:hypothetical protein